VNKSRAGITTRRSQTSRAPVAAMSGGPRRRLADTVDHIRANHRRKTGFMPGFEALAEGAGLAAEPSFLERAKTRWGVRHGRDNS